MNNHNSIRLISYLTVRRAIGFLGMLLPLIVIIGASLANFPILQSISDYYYTNMGSVFSGILCAVATFFFTYKGYDNDAKILGILNDNRVTNIAAVCAILVAFFPCHAIYVPNNGSLLITQTTVNAIHYASAALLFTLLGCMSFFFFTLSEKDIKGNPVAAKPTHQKHIRNTIYRTCAIVMWVAIIGMAITSFYNINFSTLIGEAVCLLAFGFSWLIKGETFFTDKPNFIASSQIGKTTE